MVEQGELYWLDFGEPDESEPAFKRPFVVVQNDLFNYSRIRTALACALTTNMRRAHDTGNVVLEQGEGGLPKKSVVIVAQIETVNKSTLTDRLGKLSRH